jgi:hypothetical protein
MDESEYALRDASGSPLPHVSRIANSIVNDNSRYRLWESRHADLLLPVAKHSNMKRQIVALRNTEVQLVHRRALFDFLRDSEVRSGARRQLFHVFHRTLDYESAVLVEHRQYMLAVSSHISANHLIDVMNDDNSKALLRQYEKMYARYFEMNCYVAGMGDSECIELVRSGMGDALELLQRLRRRIESVPPKSGCGSFDRQELIARSGRYPVLNYMVG